MVKKLSDKVLRRRLIIAVVLIMFFMAFILINAEYKAGVIFLVLTGISGLLILNWDRIPKKRPERKLF